MPTSLPPSAVPLTPADRELVDLARCTIDAATDAGPDEDGIHTMGAAVRTADGGMHAGVNLYHFTGGPCAELVALGAARAAGAADPTCIVAVGNHGRGVQSPCGRDRQILADYYPGIRVILPTPEGPVSIPAEDLLPLGFVPPAA
ncbi:MULTISPECIES: cytidine deaminase [unclassified Arthrobacter]|uniref:cytidine deaminase n=1 Tax=unclassified Arthrobacter TaxID=235627 RepID=UPI001D136248|nr:MULTISPECIES: cytidine deaminase [unclassified Arthrobacter]MCC3291202.1 cytidine deaminase [Arthrobacter sp. zg-Y1110]MCC3301396.1 cytidine deaminase [Arthrobacter sp. zg-Y895]UWX83633.1 cytidine deaminase [Arthrobacter sp. zg-Y1110]